MPPPAKSNGQRDLDPLEELFEPEQRGFVDPHEPPF
jgi:hypothetical protein